MVALALFFGFAMAFVSSMAPTGPIALLVIERGISRRYAEGRAIAAGAAIVEGMWAALGAFGVSALFLRFPGIELGARIASVVVLLALGVRFLKYTGRLEGFEVDAEPTARGLSRSFFLGSSIALLNPVLVVAWSTSIALLLSLGRLRFDAACRVAFAAGVPLGIVAWFSLLLFLLRRREGQVTVRIARRILQVAGAVLVATAVFFGASLLMTAAKAYGH